VTVRRRLLLALVGVLLVLAPAAASAHPLGNFSVNRYLRAEASGGSLYLRHVVDLAEIPAFQERGRVDAAGGLRPWARARAREQAGDLVVTAGGRRLDAVPVSWAARWAPGAGGLRTLRLAAWYRVPAPGGLPPGPLRLVAEDRTHAGRLGWREVVLRASGGARLAGAGAAGTDRSAELTDYPPDRLARPLTVSRADAEWTPGQGAGPVAADITDAGESPAADRPDGLAGLVTGDLSAGVVLLALVLAMGWGALHSLSPGHGKSMVAAYLVGTRGTARHALLLGGVVTATHTAGVIALGLVTLVASRYVLPETLFPWLNLVAALMVLGVGAWVLGGRLRRARSHHAHHHHHGHHHGHHGHGHHHAPPADLSPRGLLAVGAAAGIVPCPSALVLLLGAISIHRVGYGLVLVLAFSAGLAGVLSLIGLLVLRARRLIDRVPMDGRIAAAVPVASAVVILVLGVVLTVRAVPGIA
jgi:ABC-type nickel/cobalt efflux system permease component RcnA